MKAKNKKYPLIPEEERECIWMTTGLISYKLCDRSYQCETCPFDQAIKNEESGKDDLPEDGDQAAGPLGSDAAAWINGSVFYHPGHCWVKVESPERVRIGIDCLLTQLLMDVEVVILPAEGSQVSPGECYAHLIEEDYIVPLISPLSGLVQTVNPRLQKEPQLIIADPRGDGWLITITPENLESELKPLLFGKKALSWYRREEKEIIARTVAMMLKEGLQAVGPTMQDGGVRINCLKDLLTIVDARQRSQMLDFSLGPRKKS